MATIIALHGYTMNGDRMRRATSPLLEELAPDLRALYPDAPHVCSQEAVVAAFTAWQQPVPPPPHFTWWRATDDGRRYDGLDDTVALLRALLGDPAIARGPIGLIGFSQGAMVAAVAAALSARGELPPLGFAVLIAGRAPRAEALRPMFAPPLALPTLHVWGEADPSAPDAPSLVECFAESTRSTLVWPGRHAVPTRGAAAERVRAFISTHSALT